MFQSIHIKYMYKHIRKKMEYLKSHEAMVTCKDLVGRKMYIKDDNQFEY